MTVDPLGLMSEVDRATERLLRNVADLRDADLEAPSRLTGWSRGALLARIADNARTAAALLTAAAHGHVAPHATPRVTDTPPPAAGSVAAHLRDLRASADQFADAAAAMPLAAWGVEVTYGDAPPRPAAALIWDRLRVVELHHVDLDVGYSTADWSEAFSHRLLHDVVTGCGDRRIPPVVLAPIGTGHPLMIGTATDGVPTVRGPLTRLAGWLTGRGDGDGLTVEPEGPLPSPPIWM